MAKDRRSNETYDEYLARMREEQPVAMEQGGEAPTGGGLGPRRERSIPVPGGGTAATVGALGVAALGTGLAYVAGQMGGGYSDQVRKAAEPGANNIQNTRAASPDELARNRTLGGDAVGKFTEQRKRDGEAAGKKAADEGKTKGNGPEL